MAIPDRPDWHDNDEEILAFQEEAPDIYDFVLKTLDGNCDDTTLLDYKSSLLFTEGSIKIKRGF